MEKQNILAQIQELQDKAEQYRKWWLDSDCEQVKLKNEIKRLNKTIAAYRKVLLDVISK